MKGTENKNQTGVVEIGGPKRVSAAMKHFPPQRMTQTRNPQSHSNFDIKNLVLEEDLLKTSKNRIIDFGEKQEDPRGNFTTMDRNSREEIKNEIAADGNDGDKCLAPSTAGRGV
ncbi:hypothetical protein HAX54_021343, partial [Datura stramonium]|nr:hypothetical protein [Datura stramonium]